MESDNSVTSQGWLMYQLGLLNGQSDALLKKAAVITTLHDKVRKGELDPATTDTHAGLEELVELAKKYQNNASMLVAYALMWRVDWKRQHGKAPELPEPEKS